MSQKLSKKARLRKRLYQEDPRCHKSWLNITSRTTNSMDDWKIEIKCYCGSKEWVSDKAWQFVHSGINDAPICHKCNHTLLGAIRDLPKRTYCYVQSPANYGIANCPQCDTPPQQYSEYHDRVWCEKCQIDYIPTHFGVFDGPIALEACELLGMSFDRIHIPTGNLERFVPSGETGWWPEVEADRQATPLNILPPL